jgi:carbon-monoxide dehydrogenase small subunit
LRRSDGPGAEGIGRAGAGWRVSDRCRVAADSLRGGVCALLSDTKQKSIPAAALWFAVGGAVQAFIPKGDSMTISLSLTVNGTPVTAEVQPHTLLVEFLRENLRLTGTHVGCDTAQCGACTVHLNGDAIKSCNVLAAQCNGMYVTTIEGLAKDDALHPMQAAFRECHGLQCGFCTPGMVMSAAAFVARCPHPTEQQVREQLDGNLCRCTGYHNIVKAVLAGADAMAGATSAAPVATTV